MADLFSKLVFRNGVTAPNRTCVAPMTNLQSHADGTLSEEELRWLSMRAAGGFGTIETAAAHVSRDGQGWEGELGIFDDALLPGLTRYAAALRAHGGVAVVQLYHGGVRSSSKLIGRQPWSASAFDESTPGFERSAPPPRPTSSARSSTSRSPPRARTAPGSTAPSCTARTATS